MSKFHTTEFDFYPDRAFQPRPGGGMTLEGGKGGSAPAPDQALLAQQAQSMATQTEMLSRMTRNADELQPLQREQLEFGLSTSRTAYEQSQEDRKYALGRRAQLDGAMQPFLDEAANFDEGTRRAELMTEANADISRSFGQAQEQQTRGLQRMGVNATSGRTAAMTQQGELAEATARANAGRKVSEAAKAEGLTLRANAVNMLNGAPAAATAATGAGANYGAMGTGLTTSGLAGMNSGYTAVGQGAGSVAGQAAGMYGTQLNAWQAGQNAKSQANGEMWGAVAGAGLMLLSDPRLKENVKAVGKLDNGMTVYTYTYRGGNTYHMGVMADEAQKVVPQAVGEISGYLAVDYSKL